MPDSFDNDTLDISNAQQRGCRLGSTRAQRAKKSSLKHRSGVEDVNVTAQNGAVSQCSSRGRGKHAATPSRGCGKQAATSSRGRGQQAAISSRGRGKQAATSHGHGK